MKSFTYILLVLVLSLGACADLGFNKKESSTQEPKVETIDTVLTWHNMEKGIELAQKEGKNIFIDVYTDWCGYCKKMDAYTFSNPSVMSALNKDYITVKLNGETKAPINFYGTTYNFVDNGRRGYHELAAVLLDGRMSYPSFVVLGPNGNRLKKIVGYMNPQQFLIQLK